MSRKRKIDSESEQPQKKKTEEKQETNRPKTMELIKPKFRRGNILKITMHNFMTYDDCSFEPGPGLNLVLGPNGTGKSSIVSAICVGLHGNPKLLGRATKVNDYIKHGRENAYVEIEICNDDGGNVNKRLTIRRYWTRGKESSEWHVNGKPSKSELVKSLVTGFNIKLDNLTQFLPQDRVCEFAGLGPVELLRKTEEAVLPPESCKYHDDLIDIQKNHSVELRKVTDFQDSLNILKKKNESIEKDVQKFREREALLIKVEQLKVKKSALLLTEKQNEAKKVKIKKDEAEKEFEMFKAELKPLADKINEKKKELDLLHKKKEQEKATSKKNNNIETVINQLNIQNNKKQQFIQEIQNLKERKKEREQKKQRLDQKLSEAKRNHEKLETPDQIQEELKKKNEEYQKYDSEYSEAQIQRSEIDQKIEDLQRERKQLNDSIKALDDVKNQRLNEIKRSKPQLYEMYDWYRRHTDKFEKEVFFLPLEISIAENIHCRYFEQQIGNFLYCFVFQTFEDQELFLKESTFKKVNITAVLFDERRQQSHQNPIPINELKQYGITHYMDQTFQSKPIIKAVINNNSQMNRVIVGTRETSKIIDQVLKVKHINLVYTPESRYFSKTSKYDSNQTSIQIIPIRDSKLFKGVDLKQKDELVKKVETLTEKIKNYESTKKEHEKTEQKLLTKREEIKNQKKVFEKKKRDYQFSLQNIEKIENEISQLAEEENIKDEDEIHKQIRTCNQLSVDLLEKFTKGMKEFHESILNQTKYPFKIHKMNKELQTLIEKEKETFDRKEILQQNLDELNQSFQRIRDQFAIIKENANNDKASFKSKYQISEEEMSSILLKLPDDLKIVEDQIFSSQDQAGRIYDNPEIIREYENRKKEIEQKEEKLKELKEILEKKMEQIEEKKIKWMKEISAIVTKVNVTFMEYCKNIGISGEVSLLPSDDFEKYEIQIKVKFRDSEQLSTLSTTRQSGGERSVTTILYLLALQGINKCPLRVVDEINQGMDPINERKIFLQMLEASSGEDVPQSFLITPKLLPDLVPENTSNITVLFIFNGAYNLSQKDLLEELK